jgi:hypothetical protein
MVVPAREEILAWTAEERALVARGLDETSDRPDAARRTPWTRLVVLTLTLGGVAVLLPWILYLSWTLPGTQTGGAWRVAWVGFDAALALSLAVTGWLAWHRRYVVVVGLVVSASLILTDAWFDLCLSWNTPEQNGAVASALLVEIPVAALLARSAIVVLRRTAETTARLRGRPDGLGSLWRQPMVRGPR